MHCRHFGRWPLFSLGLAAMLGATGGALASPALPGAAQVVAGSASLERAGGQLTVDQTSSRAIIDWSSFSIGQGGKVAFDNGSGATLNRVTGAAASMLDGQLTATGSVWLLNPHGVIVGKDGVVRTGGTFVASSLGIGDQVFLAGRDKTLAGASTARVINLGRIGSLGGDVALIAADVVNEGTISAKRGTAGLIAGAEVTIRDRSLAGGQFAVVVGGPKTSVANGGLIQAADAELRAEGGNVYALAGDTAGVIRATAVNAGQGKVWLVASGGALDLAGVISAKGGDGAGGTIETSGADVSLGSARISARGGAWLVDPYDLTVDAAAATTIETALAADTDVTLQTNATSASGAGVQNASGNGDIIIASPLSWSTGATLTLSAYRNVGVNADIAVGGAGALALTTGTGTTGDYLIGAGESISFTGGSTAGASLAINGAAYTLIYSMSDLQAINTNVSSLGGYYALAQSLDASGVSSWTPLGTNGKGVVPQNSSGEPVGFSGEFAGLGHSIASLTVNIGSAPYGGLFGYSSGTIRDVGVVGGAETAGGNVGGLVGGNRGTIDNDFSSSAVAGCASCGSANVGGLIGMNFGVVTNSYSTGSASGGGDVGGLIGIDVSGLVTNSYATGSITGAGTYESYGGDVVRIASDGSIVEAAQSGYYAVGGLVGWNQSGTITGSHATGTVNAGQASGWVGGLVGLNDTPIADSYATGSVSGGSDVGGLVGANYFCCGVTGVSINGSFASGAVTGVGAVGGLVGLNMRSVNYSKFIGPITNSFATGSVSGSAWVGGLVGGNDGAISLSYSVGAVTGSISTGGLVGDLSSSLGNGTVVQSYWNTQSSGQSTSAGGTGLTTAQLQGILPAGFATANWFAATGAYPTLEWEPAAGIVQIVAGAAYTSAEGAPLANTTVVLLVNGVDEGTATTDAQGGFTFDLSPGTLPSAGSDIAVYLSGAMVKATNFYQTSGSLSGVTLIGGELNVDSSHSTQSFVMQQLDTAVGASADSDLLFTAAGGFAGGARVEESLTASKFSINDLIDLGSDGLVIHAAGSVAETGAGAIDARYFAGTADGVVALDGDNAISILKSFDNHGSSASLTDDSDLALHGDVLAGSGDLSLTTTGAGDFIKFEGDLAVSGDLTLDATSRVVETTRAKIVTSLLNVTAKTGIRLISTLNHIVTVGTDTTASGSNRITQ